MNRILSLYVWLLVNVLISLSLSNLCYELLLRSGEIVEFRQFFKYYSFSYNIVFILLFLAILIVYLNALKRMSAETYPKYIIADILGSIPVLLILLFSVVYIHNLIPQHWYIFVFALSYLVILRIYLISKSAYYSHGFKAAARIVLLTAFLVLALVPRLYFMLGVYQNLSSDEAVMGLMARHMIFKHEFPVFLYAQARPGSLEALMSIPIFFLFGASPTSFKVVPLLASLGLIISIYIFARNAFGEKVGLISAAFTALGSAFLSVYSVSTIAYIEFLLLGMIQLIILQQISENELRHIHNNRIHIIFGLIIGLGIWNNFMILPWSFVVILAYAWINRKNLSIRRIIFSFIGIILGALPAIIFNIQHPGASIAEQLRNNRYVNLSELIYGVKASFAFLFSDILPSAYGIDHLLSGYPLVGIALFCLYLASIGFCLVAIFYNSHFWKKDRFWLAVLAIIFIINLLSYVTSKSSTSLTLRYAIVFVPQIIIFLGYFLGRLSDNHKTLVIMLMSLALIANIGGYISEGEKPRLADTGTDFRTASQIVAFLDQKHIDRVFSDYWIAYQLTFFTKERIICAPNPGFDRYPQYTLMIKSQPASKITYIYETRSEPLERFLSTVKDKGINSRKKQIGRYSIFYNADAKVFD